jgi:hypothetical protein
VERAAGKIHTFFHCNAPIGHYQYEYSKEVQQKRGQFGAKVFFYNCAMMEGTVKLETKLYTDYAWVTRFGWRSFSLL